jgi:hypothetical protein
MEDDPVSVPIPPKACSMIRHRSIGMLDAVIVAT